MGSDQRLKKLARQIEALADKDARLLARARDIALLRRQAAAELHAICRRFVTDVNHLLPAPVLDLSPEEYGLDLFRDPGLNLVQINARGRLLQCAFQATDALISTEDFKIPYILHGEVRTYNQEMLERSEIEWQRIFYCIERDDRHSWHYEERGGYRTGYVDNEFLTSVLEHIL